MFLRIDKLQIELPASKEASPNAAAAVQELLGGRFGEMSTLMNYMYQSFNFKEKVKLKPYYDLIANIAAEELGHIELVSATINNLLSGSVEKTDDPIGAPLRAGLDMRNTAHFIDTGLGAKAFNSMGAGWDGNNFVFSSGNLVLDLLHNFFLENGARAQKIRVYEMTDNPVAREMIGYLLNRGGVHALAYGKALEKLTGVEIWKMLPIPAIPNSKFPEARKMEEKGYHRFLYRFSMDDYKDMGTIWNGTHPEDGSTLEVVDGPPEGGEIPVIPEEPAMFAPGVDQGMMDDIAAMVLKAAGLKNPNK